MTPPSAPPPRMGGEHPLFSEISAPHRLPPISTFAPPRNGGEQLGGVAPHSRFRAPPRMGGSTYLLPPKMAGGIDP